MLVNGCRPIMEANWPEDNPRWIRTDGECVHRRERNTYCTVYQEKGGEHHTFSCTFQAWAKGVGVIDEIRPERGQGWQVRPGPCDCFVLAETLLMVNFGCVLAEILMSRGRILGLNPDKSHKSFPPCYQGWAKLVLIALERYSVELKRLTFNFR